MFKSNDTLKHKLTNNSNKMKKSGIVYEIPCKDCEMCNIGQTGKSLETRVHHHKYSVRTAQENNAVFNHKFISKECHQIDWNSSQTITNCSDFVKRNILECICINSFKSFNFNKGLYNLDSFILQLISNRNHFF